jgi:hypothetical protein
MPKMDREIVLKTVTANWDERIKKATQLVGDLRNPEHLTALVAEWRSDCEARVSGLYARILKAEVTDEELSGWKLPPMPGRPEAWVIDRAERDIQSAINSKEHALAYLAARKADDDGALTLSQSELERVGFYQ